MSDKPLASKIYCLAPFYHSHVDSEGVNRLCCIARNELVPQIYQAQLTIDPAVFWNSDYIKDRRELMLKKESPPECYFCRHPNSNSPYRDIFFDNFSEEFESLNCKVNPDFSVNHLPYSVDYRTAICNLRCIMCHSGSSTSINAQFKKRADDISREHGSIYVLHHENLLERSERTYDHLEKIVAGGNLRFAYFAGGEPTMTKDHLGLIDRILKNNSEHTHITYNTNLMQTNSFVVQWRDKLAKFDYVGLFCSIDAVGEIGEYLRDGLSLKRFEENLKSLLEIESGKLNITLDATLTSLGLLNSIELSKFALSYGVALRGRLVIDCYRSSFLFVNFLSQELRSNILHAYEEFYKTLSDSSKVLLSEYYQSLKTATVEPGFTKEQLQQAELDIRFMKTLYPEKSSFDEILKKHIKSFIP